MEKVKDIVIGGKKLNCKICGSNEFYRVYTKLNKKWFAALDLELFSQEGTAYICSSCGYKHEFYKF